MGNLHIQIPHDMTNCGFLQIYTDNFVSLPYMVQDLKQLFLLQVKNPISRNGVCIMTTVFKEQARINL